MDSNDPDLDSILNAFESNLHAIIEPWTLDKNAALVSNLYSNALDPQMVRECYNEAPWKSQGGHGDA